MNASSETRSRLAVDLYEKLTNEEDARVCEDISDDACHETPQNFLLILLSQFLTKLGDALASPKTVLAWVTSAVGAPAFVLGLLVPLRESGSLIPQLFIGSVIRRLPVRKWVWVVGSLVQAACVAGLGVVALTLTGTAAGMAILALVAVFSLARGFCSVSSKDVLGKTVPKRKRGQLTGWSASAAGVVTMVVGLALLGGPLAAQPSALGLLLMGAGALWVVAALIYGLLREFPGETGGGGNAAAEALRRISVLRDDRPFRQFVTARALLMCSALSAPFYVALSQQHADAAISLLGFFVIADGLASMVSAPLWGRAADRSSRKVMIVAALITAGTGALVVLVAVAAPGLIATPWFVPGAYLLLCVAHNGVRVGRKTYVIDLGSGNRRTDYVAVSNSVIGVLLLGVGAVGALVPVVGHAGVIAILSLLGFAGALMSARLPEA